MRRKKILIIGHARHGKDTVAEMMEKFFGFTFESSSIAACRIFLFDALKDKYGYTTPEHCFEDRVNHREEWKDLICEYNKVDKARLAREIIKSYDIYVGMRDDEEIQACMDHRLFDHVIAVYDPRKPKESSKSFNIDMWAAADIVIPNAWDLPALERKVHALLPLIAAA